MVKIHTGSEYFRNRTILILKTSLRTLKNGGRTGENPVPTVKVRMGKEKNMSQENNFVPEQEQYKKLRPFQIFMKNNFPFIENTFMELDNYVLLAKVTEYLNNVISNENNVESNVTALYNAFVSLNNYVSNYFDNLDVQEEINNKLDEMATTGVLQNIISQYFNDVNEQIAIQNSQIDTLESRMDSFTNLEQGSTTGDAELIDIRLGNDGIVYNSAGSAIRT